jgi:hypothetical protein
MPGRWVASRLRLAWPMAMIAPAVLGTPALAVDGVIEINQTSAVAGGPGDSPGFPVEISQSGSYRLTSDLDATGTAVSISADEVTLDLNGFTIRCASCSGGSVGIDADAPSGTTVRNGTVTGFADAGARLGANARVEDLRLVANSGAGLDVSGPGGIVADSQAASNGGAGFDLATGCRATGLAASSNGGNGFTLAEGCTLSHSTATSNGGVGISAVASSVTQSAARDNVGVGISASASTVVGCSSSANHDDGVFATGGSVIVDNTSSANTGDGFQTQDAASLRENMATGNAGYGIRVTVTFMTPGATYDRNTAWGNLSGGFVGSGFDQGSNVCIKGTAPGC